MSENSGIGQDLNALNAWYELPFGRILKAHIADELLRSLKSLPVHELLHLGVGGFEEVLAGRKRERMIFFTDIACQNLFTKNENTLPLKQNSQECVVLLHGLDLADDPHAILREIERIVAIGGYLVIVGFNSFSPWGLYRPLRNICRWQRCMPWILKFYNIRRLRDWLRLLGFDVCNSRTLNYLPLLQRQTVLEKLTILNSFGKAALPFMGNIYILTAQKRSSPLTPFRFDWKLQTNFLKPGLFKPGVRC